VEIYQDSLINLPAANPQHPAKFTEVLIPVMAKMLQGRKRILDPFGGTGRCFLLEAWLPDAEIQAVEIEPEWAAINPRTTLGNALSLPWPAGYFDAVCTSPTYGNRMADTTFSSSIGNTWQTYSCKIGRRLHPDNSGAMDWGDKYRTFHVNAWTEARRVLQPGGAFVLNIKDHIRGGELQHVTEWHVKTLCGLGFVEREHKRINTPSMRYGRNGDKRVEYESVILFILGDA